MVIASGLFASGILTLLLLPKMPPEIWLVFGVITVGVCVFFRLWRLMMYVIGLVWAGFFAAQHYEHILTSGLEGKDMVVTGTIASLPQLSDAGIRFDFIIEPAETVVRLPSKLRITWYYPETAVKAGQRWRFTVRLKQPHGMMNPGTFDYEQWLFVNGIGATGYVRQEPAPLLLDNSSGWFNLLKWRQHLADKLQEMLNGSEQLGIIQALVIGERDAIPARQWEVLRKTGTVHLMAISGLHIGLVAGLAYIAALKLSALSGSMRIAPPDIAALASLSLAVLYSALAGFSIPTVRALIMLVVAMSAIMLQRHTKPLNILSLAFLVTLLIDPFAVLSTGFWLSFFAVALIVFRLSGRRRKLGYWAAMLKINWATSIGLAPLLYFFFQQVSLIAPLANLIAVPLVSFIIVPMALFSSVLMEFVPFVADKLFRCLDLSLELLLGILTYLSELPFAGINGVQPDLWVLLLAMAGILLLLSPAGLPGRRLGLMLMLPLVAAKPEKIDPGMVKFTLLDVGQGLSAVVQTRNHVLVYDAGARLSADYDMGESVVLPFLRTRGLTQVNMLMISHGDNDHIGGAFSIIDHGAVENVVSSVPELFASGTASHCITGRQWTWDKVEFRILAPPVQGFAEENDNSCVLKVTSEFGNVLLTGDIEATAEQWLVKNYSGGLQAEILIAPHHGSKSSSSSAFIQMVKPQYILIPAGYRNRFSHPHAGVLSKYDNLGIDHFNTADQGALEVLLNSAQLTVNSYRQQAGNYWNWPFEENNAQR